MTKAAQRLVTQRRLIFGHIDTKVGAMPDRRGQPAVVDWKVHSFGWHDAWLQLTIYAAALTRAEPHADFPPRRAGTTPRTLAARRPIDLRKVMREVQCERKRLIAVWRMVHQR